MADYKQYINTKVMNRWVIDQYIGRGQSGVVYKAHGPQGDTVAVKIISIPNEQQIKEGESAYGGDRELMESFFDQVANKFVAETESLRRLSNSDEPGSRNIIRYIDHVASKRDMEWEIVIVMEYVMSLKEYFASHPLDVGTVVNLGIGIATGLEHCHKMKVIHRDIKDDNIFADARGDFKIGDFGVANMYSATRASTRVGTPYFMAPEVHKGEEYNAGVDLYSLGIVLYKLSNYGRFPFAPSVKEKAKLLIDDNDKAFKRRMGGEELPDPEFCPEKLAGVLRRACAYRPDERFATATEMKTALMEARNTMSREEWEMELPAPPSNWRPMRENAEPERFAAEKGARKEPNEHDVTQRSGVGEETKPVFPVEGSGNYIPTVSLEANDNDPNMKTTALLTKMEGTSAGRKIMEIVKQRESAEGMARSLKRRSKTLKIGIAAASAAAALAIAGGVLLWPQTYSYSANSDDNYYLYRYQFGQPKKRVLKDGTEPVPASYVKCDKDWIYFSLHDKPFSDDGDHRMYKMKKDGTQMTQLTEDHCEYNILYNGWIYYLSQLEGNALCRIKTDGANKEVLINEERITGMYMEKEDGKIVISMESGGKKVVDVNGDEILIGEVTQ